MSDAAAALVFLQRGYRIARVVACPFCKAAANEVCKRTRGKRVGEPTEYAHARRIKLRDRLLEEGIELRQTLTDPLPVDLRGDVSSYAELGQWLLPFNEQSNAAPAVLVDLIMESLPCKIGFDAILQLTPHGLQRFAWMRHRFLHSDTAYIDWADRSLVIPDCRRLR